MPFLAFLAPVGRVLSAKVGLWLPMLLLIALGIQTARFSASRHHSTKVEKQLADKTTEFENFKLEVISKTALAKAQDAANAARVEAAQEKARAQNDSEIRARIAAAVASVRHNAEAGNGRLGPARMPPAPNAAGGTAGAGQAAELDDKLICSENTAKLQGWSEWWNDVSQIAR